MPKLSFYKSIPNFPRWLIHTLFLIIVLILTIPIWQSGELAYGDLAAFPRNVSQAFKEQLITQRPISQGVTSSFSIFYFVVYPLTLVLSLNSPLFASHLYLFLLIILSYFSAYFFLSRFFQRPLIIFPASIFYALNPVVIGLVNGGAAGVLFIHSIIPLLIYLIIQIYQQVVVAGHIRLFTILAGGLIFAFCFGVGGYIHILLLAVYSILSIWLISQKKLSQFFKLTLAVGTIFIFCLVLNLTSVLVSKGVVAGEIASSTRIEGFAADMAGLYGGNPLEKISFVHNLPWAYSTPERLILVGLTLLLIISSLVIFLKNRKLYSKIKFALITALLLILVIILIRFGILVPLFKKFSFLFTYRNPTKFLSLLSFTYAIFLATVLNFLFLLPPKRRLVRTLGIVLVGIFILFSLKPTLTEKFGLAHKPSLPEVPKHFYQIADFLNEQERKEGSFRTLWLPWTYEEEEVKIRSLDSRTLSLPLGFSQFASSPMGSYINALYTAIARGEGQNLASFLGIGGVKYIIINRDSPLAGKPQVSESLAETELTGDPSILESVIKSQNQISLVKETSQYAIYQNELVQPSVRAVPYLVPVGQIFSPQITFDHLSHLNIPLANFLIALRDLNQVPLESKLPASYKTISLSPVIFSDDFSRFNPQNWETQVPPVSEKGQLHLSGDQNTSLSTTMPIRAGSRITVRALIERADKPTVIMAENITNRISFDLTHIAGVAYKGKLRTITTPNLNRGESQLKEIGEFEAGKWHIFEIEWLPDKINFFFDGKLVSSHQDSLPLPQANLKLTFQRHPEQTILLDNVSVRLINQPPLELPLILEEPVALDIQTENSEKVEVSTEASQRPLFFDFYLPFDRALQATDERGNVLTKFLTISGTNGFILNDPDTKKITIKKTNLTKDKLIIYLTPLLWLILVSMLIIFYNRSHKKG